MAKFCQNCGQPVNEGNLFCESCGARLVSQQNAQPEKAAAPQPVQPSQQTPRPAQETPQPVRQPQQPVQPYPQPAQKVQQPVRPYPQPAQPYPQYNVSQPPKKKGWIIALIITGVVTLAALVVIVILILQAKKPTGVIAVPTEPYSVIQQSTEAPTEALTEAPTEAPAQAPTAAPKTAPTQAPKTAPTQAPKKTPKNAPTEPPAALPYVDSLGSIKDSDFAWIADAMSGGMTGSFISNDDLVGKWKGEIIYDGVWELVYVTIDRDGSISVEPCQINYGEGWESEYGDDPYTFTGSFDINRVYGSGKYGKIDLYQFITSGGTQYGMGEFHVSNGNEAKIYLVRP